MWPSIKFVSKHAAESFKHSKRVFETLDQGFTEMIESLAAFLCYNTAHTVSINHGVMFEKKDITWNNLHVPLFLWNNRSSQNSCKSLTENITKDQLI